MKQTDLAFLQSIIETTGLFPSGLLEEMMEDYFTNEASQDIWLTRELGGRPVILAYVAPEKLTIGTYNLYLIAVHRDLQGRGLGTGMMAYIEQYLQSKGARILIVETSGLPHFAGTRRFYEQCRYEATAVIREFYNQGGGQNYLLEKTKQGSKLLSKLKE